MHLCIEADGGSRGNPGIAGAGTVVLNADKTEVIQRISEYLGSTTNNVAEYHALLNGLNAALERGASSVAVYMDSKLVVEQMSGRWKIKHPDMRELALKCRTIATQIGQVTYEWVPRKNNSRADELANKAMDAGAQGAAVGMIETHPPAQPARTNAPHGDTGDTGDKANADNSTQPGAGGAKSPAAWNGATTTPTRLFLARHGQTADSVKGVYSGCNSNPPLNDTGQAQARALARRLRGENITHIVASPQLRAQQTAAACAEELGLDVITLDDLRELDFGSWEGLTFAQARASDEETHTEWLTNTSVAPPGGESLQQAYRRAKKTLSQIIDTCGATNVLVVSHVTPIKGLIRLGLDAGPSIYHCLHLDLASLSIAEFYADGPTSVRLVGETAHLHADGGVE
ncbi:bifunctional RNase H/acid phosphatase [Corynebacterium aquilae]|uniref:Acid phosphatase n=1 Tax=Corynebacterium aquilae DSM 44791 TaxID=1431546 RepID=A0A1L7CH09_9CORY|nr:bifunctional RNase H/acid phosphatase [Corynebacterium aquilae]APT85152.1 acid phosphatase [Corynebacterium aquilae DSM 44791]